jgi:hypothetical protein
VNFIHIHTITGGLKLRVWALNDSQGFLIAVGAAAEGDNGLSVSAANYEFVVRLVVINVM